MDRIMLYLFNRKVKRLHKAGLQNLVELHDVWNHIGYIKLYQY